MPFQNFKFIKIFKLINSIDKTKFQFHEITDYLTK